MAPQTATRMTYREFMELPEVEGKQYELIEGELFVNPAPVPKHQFVTIRVSAAMHVHLTANGGGRVLIAPVDVVLAEDVILQPDVLLILDERAAIIGEKNVQGAPNLVVEVLSEGTRRRDEIQKRRLYETYGVDEYWVADPAIDLVKIYRREADVFVRVAEIESGGVVTTPLLPGFALPVDEIFA